jgi:glycosyltransferase involved in cell wall biosynthesis
MERKKRILFCGEASFLNTGFSTYYRELLPRLVATGKYEIAELGSYARQDDPRVKEFIQGRWKFYGTLPTNPQEAQAFNQPCPHPRARGQNTNQFGEGRFDFACADFQPDIVIDIRDWWMLEYQERSVFRPWYKWCIMPTVDAEPQAEEWIQTYENANVVLTYSDYGIETLKRQTANVLGKPRMKILPKPMRPGVDLETFHPMDKTETKDFFNLNKENLVIGSVMRNQSRKLYPDLIDAFACMKRQYAGEPAVDKAVLMIHSAWPDNQHSFDYPRHIMRLEAYDWMPNAKKGIRGDILQSMKCMSCGEISWTYAMNLFGKEAVNDGKGNRRIKLPCPLCGAEDASPPGTNSGFTREQLAKLYNALDVYVQCSICEGDGMPIQEAKACGVPSLVVDYTAMREKGRFPNYEHLKEVGETDSSYTCHLGGDVIPVDRYYYEPETSCKRALPDIYQLAGKMRELLNDEARRRQMSEDARRCVEENYNWNELWKQWEFVLDKIKPLDRSNTWDSPIEPAEDIVAQPIPEGLSDQAFIEWLYTDILKYPAVDPNGAKMWMEHIAAGASREQLLHQFLNIGNQQSNADKVRQQLRAAVASQGQETIATPTQTQEWC